MNFPAQLPSALTFTSDKFLHSTFTLMTGRVNCCRQVLLTLGRRSSMIMTRPSCVLDPCLMDAIRVLGPGVRSQHGFPYVFRQLSVLTGLNTEVGDMRDVPCHLEILLWKCGLSVDGAATAIDSKGIEPPMCIQACFRAKLGPGS